MALKRGHAVRRIACGMLLLSLLSCFGCEKAGKEANAVLPSPTPRVVSPSPPTAAPTIELAEEPKLPPLPEGNAVLDDSFQENRFFAYEGSVYALEYEGDLVRTLWRTSADTGAREIVLRYVVNDIELAQGGYFYVNAFEEPVWAQYVQVAEEDKDSFTPAFFRVDAATGKAEKVAKTLYMCSPYKKGIAGLRPDADDPAQFALCILDQDGEERILPYRYSTRYELAFIAEGYAYLYDAFGGGEGEILRTELSSGESQAVAPCGIPCMVVDGLLYYTETDYTVPSSYRSSTLYALSLEEGGKRAVLTADAYLGLVERLGETLLMRAAKERGTWYFAYAPGSGLCEPLFKEDARFLGVYGGAVYYTIPKGPSAEERRIGMGVYRMNVGEREGARVFDGEVMEVCVDGDVMYIATKLSLEDSMWTYTPLMIG